jgi:hypothetical protein
MVRQQSCFRHCSINFGGFATSNVVKAPGSNAGSPSGLKKQIPDTWCHYSENKVSNMHPMYYLTCLAPFTSGEHRLFSRTGLLVGHKFRLLLWPSRGSTGRLWFHLTNIHRCFDLSANNRGTKRHADPPHMQVLPYNSLSCSYTRNLPCSGLQNGTSSVFVEGLANFLHACLWATCGATTWMLTIFNRSSPRHCHESCFEHFKRPRCKSELKQNLKQMCSLQTSHNIEGRTEDAQQ